MSFILQCDNCGEAVVTSAAELSQGIPAGWITMNLHRASEETPGAFQSVDRHICPKHKKPKDVLVRTRPLSFVDPTSEGEVHDDEVCPETPA